MTTFSSFFYVKENKAFQFIQNCIFLFVSLGTGCCLALVLLCGELILHKNNKDRGCWEWAKATTTFLQTFVKKERKEYAKNWTN